MATNESIYKNPTWFRIKLPANRHFDLAQHLMNVCRNYNAYDGAKSEVYKGKVSSRLSVPHHPTSKRRQLRRAADAGIDRRLRI
jgi:hypothetical protein